MGGYDTAALRHAGDLGFLDIVTLGERGAGEHFSSGHDALAADADHQDIGDGVWIAISAHGDAPGWAVRPVGLVRVAR